MASDDGDTGGDGGAQRGVEPVARGVAVVRGRNRAAHRAGVAQRRRRVLPRRGATVIGLPGPALADGCPAPVAADRPAARASPRGPDTLATSWPRAARPNVDRHDGHLERALG